MKCTYFALTLSGLASLVAAQIPSCATKCIADAVASKASCSATDLVCQCQPANQQAIATDPTTVSCVITACGDQALAVQAAAAEACKAVLASPPASSAPATSAPATSAPAPTSAPASSAPASSAPASHSHESTSTPPDSFWSTVNQPKLSSSGALHPSGTPYASPPPSASASSTSSPGGNSSAPTSTGASPPQVTNSSGKQLAIRAGSLLAAGIAALAML
ncbi:hypothetical protein HYALB_00001547 [Hymenoscyphus albidus]|uniref:CFEM domain-containing protein n=1 Tax=Hymenoscyphus albidus TaxID=595503 RepID=A0A9N9LDR0_9HELO|nr:hypothetical protein HYALB_00001547 [Hymenoscyphus albidus]